MYKVRGHEKTVSHSVTYNHHAKLFPYQSSCITDEWLCTEHCDGGAAAPVIYEPAKANSLAIPHLFVLTNICTAGPMQQHHIL